MSASAPGAVPVAASARPAPPRYPRAQIGFIGLGNMGRHMAANLLKKGHQLTAYDRAYGRGRGDGWCFCLFSPRLAGSPRVYPPLPPRAPPPRPGPFSQRPPLHRPSPPPHARPAVSEAAVRDLVAKGASPASSASSAAAGADVVITMLPSSPHVSAVYAGAGGVIATARAGALLVDCSTIDPNVSKSLAATAAARGLPLVDAPVSGGVGGAEAGTLTFMVGAPAASAFDAVSPILRDMGKSVVHTGGPGTGQVAKLCNNLVLGVSMAAVSEAMNLGVRAGADPAVLAAIINTSSGRCWSSDTYNPVPGVMPGVPASRGYTGGFGAALMAKDLGLAADAARAAGAPLPTASAALATYALMCAQDGWATKDFSSIYAFLRGAGGGGKA
jgi:3-hydroxyisobutyrate dehydrogenase